ncbi:MAG: glycerol kinase GlpK [Candidatus Omnitrophica bacterium]|nr:glycerol kinase GlpK [Candidatus Omnitrophota bacterium]
MVDQDKKYIGAIDQGTTGTRFILFDHDGLEAASAYREHKQFYPKPGWVEHDPVEIWNNTLETIQQCLQKAGVGPEHLAGIGITNQRETALLWDRENGAPVHPAIVWQDRRTADLCDRLKEEGKQEAVQSKTGLPIDPYFSATKASWILDNDSGLRKRAEEGEILFGTIDTWLLWNLTGKHLTDVTNASRTLLMNLETLDWDDELLEIFRIPKKILPTIGASSEVYGDWSPPGSNVGIPVCGVLGDQQAALFGQAGFEEGERKNTYGTGSFLVLNTGEDLIRSDTGMLTTVAYQREGGSARYALEGSIFITGAAVQWLRDELGLIQSADETESLAASVESSDGVYLVPAFAGLGAPHWNPHARGMAVGLTRGSSKAHLVRATLESMAFQTRDLIEAMPASAEESPSLKVDGGAVKNDLLCQVLADTLGFPVIRPVVQETTALGAAFAAGLAVGFWKDFEEIKKLWKIDRVFEPQMETNRREELYAGWKRAVRAALAWAEDR